MGYKTTTDIFVLRGETDATITGDSGAATATIETSLDTLNREVLLIWEVDIQGGQFPEAGLNAVVSSAVPASISIHDSVQTEAGSLNLNDTNYIAGSNTVWFGFVNSLAVQEAKNPDSRSFPSRDMHPLAIVTDSQLICRTGFTSDLTLATSDTYQAKFRIMAQRAKADADTYAALVTGLI